MTTDDQKTTARRFYAALDREELATIDDLAAPDYAGHVPAGDLDRDGFKGFSTTFFAAFPGVQHEIEDVIAEDDKVVVRLTARGTHRGELMGMPPTGRTVAIPAINILCIRDGRVAEHWAQIDMAGLMQQLTA